eukprot:55603-Eustigmatos_ZCMA.PRE.1
MGACMCVRGCATNDMHTHKKTCTDALLVTGLSTVHGRGHLHTHMSVYSRCCSRVPMYRSVHSMHGRISCARNNSDDGRTD